MLPRPASFASLCGTSSSADLADRPRSGTRTSALRQIQGLYIQQLDKTLPSDQHQGNPVLLMAANTTSPAAPSSPGGMSSSSLPIVLSSVASAVGLPGNSFVVWSISKRMQKRTVTASSVSNLASADLAVLLTAPFFLHFSARGTWSFREMGCRSCHYVCGISMYASVSLITIMSSDRSSAVARPFMSQKVRTKAFARWVSAGIWVVSFSSAIPVLVYRTVKWNNRTSICAPNYPNKEHKVFHSLFEAITGFSSPFLAVVASYSDIGRRSQARRFRRSRRTGRSVVLIISAFAAFWSPYHSVNSVEAGRTVAGWDKNSPAGQRSRSARYVLIASAFSSSSVNPVSYACAGGGSSRSAGVGFVVKLSEGTGSEVSSTRRGGTSVQTPKDTPACPEPGPTDSFMTSSTIPESSK